MRHAQRHRSDNAVREGGKPRGLAMPLLVYERAIALNTPSLITFQPKRQESYATTSRAAQMASRLRRKQRPLKRLRKMPWMIKCSGMEDRQESAH